MNIKYTNEPASVNDNILKITLSEVSRWMESELYAKLDILYTPASAILKTILGYIGNRGSAQLTNKIIAIHSGCSPASARKFVNVLVALDLITKSEETGGRNTYCIGSRLLKEIQQFRLANTQTSTYGNDTDTPGEGVPLLSEYPSGVDTDAITAGVSPAEPENPCSQSTPPAMIRMLSQDPPLLPEHPYNIIYNNINNNNTRSPAPALGRAPAPAYAPAHTRARVDRFSEEKCTLEQDRPFSAQEAAKGRDTLTTLPSVAPFADADEKEAVHLEPVSALSALSRGFPLTGAAPRPLPPRLNENEVDEAGGSVSEALGLSTEIDQALITPIAPKAPVASVPPQSPPVVLNPPFASDLYPTAEREKAVENPLEVEVDELVSKLDKATRKEWEIWVDLRKSERAYNLPQQRAALQKLYDLGKAGYNMREIVATAIEAGWKSFYAPKTKPKDPDKETMQANRRGFHVAPQKWLKDYEADMARRGPSYMMVTPPELKGEPEEVDIPIEKRKENIARLKQMVKDAMAGKFIGNRRGVEGV